MTVVEDRVWDVDVVPGAGVGRYVSLALDPRRRPVIAAWLDVETRQARLTLAHHDGATWQTEEIVETFGAFCSLGLDTGGSPMIAFVDVERSAVMLTRRSDSGDGWAIETVADGAHGLMATGPSLAVNVDGGPEVCYATNDGPQIATRDSNGLWRSERVDVEPTPGNDVAFAIDNTGMRHILAREPFADALVYIREQTDGWNRRVLPWRDSPSVAGFLGDGPALTIDTTGRAHVAYWTHAGVVHGSLDGESWQTEVVIADDGAGPAPAIEVDPDGQPTIVAFNAAAGAVDLAWRDESGWHRDVIDTGGQARGVGGFVSLAVDDLGVPHVAYVADDTGGLYSTRLNRSPVAPPTVFATLVNQAITANLLDAHSDQEGDTLTVAVEPVLEPENGHVRLRSDGSFRYTSRRGYNGTDSFRYRVSDSAGLSTIGEVDIEIEVPVLIEARSHSMSDGRRSSKVSSRFRSPQLAELVGRIQRSVDGIWVDVRLGTGSRITQMVNPREGEWGTGPYRLEIRPLDRSYPLARSEEFDMPEARGFELVLRGNDGNQLVIRGNPSRPRLVLLAVAP